MRETDLAQVLSIEERVFPEDPWPRSAFSRQLDNPLAQFIVMTLGEVPKGDAPDTPRDKVIGYAGTWIIVDEAHLMNIAVAPQFQGHGLGEFLLLHVLDSMRRLGAATCTLEVRPSNTRAQSLYRRLGFHVEGRRRRYYVDNGEDALIMTTDNLATLQPLHRQRLEALCQRLGKTMTIQVLMGPQTS
ncbi:MAG: ribosomal protein S18-alanine N-acetyltransferase [Caldilineales bacterium]